MTFSKKMYDSLRGGDISIDDLFVQRDIEVTIYHDLDGDEHYSVTSYRDGSVIFIFNDEKRNQYEIRWFEDYLQLENSGLLVELVDVGGFGQ